MKSGASDWRTAKRLELAIVDQEKVDIHHIFPKDWCQKSNPPIPRTLYDSVINKTPINDKTNKMIGKRAPSEYLPRLEKEIDSHKLRQVLEAHWITPDLLYADNFAECFVERGEEMLKLIGSVMGKQISSGRDVFWDALKNAGYTDDFDDEADVEYDEIGEKAYEEYADAAD